MVTDAAGFRAVKLQNWLTEAGGCLQLDRTCWAAERWRASTAPASSASAAAVRAQECMVIVIRESNRVCIQGLGQ